MSARAPAEAGIADLLSGDAAEAERARTGGAPEPAPAKPAGRKAATSGSRSRSATRKPTSGAKRKAASKGSSKKTTARRASTAAPARPASTTDPRQIAVGILKRHGGEMPVAKLAEAVVKTGRTKLTGKTPEATVAAQIYVAATKGMLFRKVSRGVVALIDQPARSTAGEAAAGNARRAARAAS